VSSDGFAITDLETGLVVDANPAMCRMHGYSYEEIIGLHPTEFVHPDYHEAFRKHSETVKSGGSYRARSVDLRKDGTPFHVDVQGTTFTYKGKLRRLAVLRDITEQVQAYELLEQHGSGRGISSRERRTDGNDPGLRSFLDGRSHDAQGARGRLADARLG